MKPNATSIDFPLSTQYGNRVTTKELLSPLRKVRLSCVNEYNNETPDFFRLDSMFKSTQRYNNPFLNEVINSDRSESLKALDRSKSQIYYIDKLKSSRNLSQNPILIRKVQNENSKAVKANHNVLPMPISVIELPSNDVNFEEKLRALHYLYSPKLSFKVKRKVDMRNNVHLTELYQCSQYDKEHLEKLQTALDPKKSSYLRNLNDYDIKENMRVTDNVRFHFNRLEETIYNPIIDKKIAIKPSIVTTSKWNRVNETYMLMLGDLRRKGGLFSEFYNKNRVNLDLMNAERKIRTIKLKKTKK